MPDTAVQRSSLLSAIPPNRMIVYAFCIALLPIIVTFLFASHTISQAENVCRNIEEMERQILQSLRLQEVNRQVIYRFQEKDPFYLNKTVEAYHLLKREEQVLSHLQSYGNLPDFGVQDRRYKYLTGGDNNFNFVESAATITPILKETMEVQNRHVELDENDLRTVLSYIEGTVQENKYASLRPQLIVVDASLDRKKGYDREVWALSLKLLKRMYTSPIFLEKQEDKKTTANEGSP